MVWTSVGLILLGLLVSGNVSVTGAARKLTLHWNTTNPIFRIDNTDHVMDVNVGNSPLEFDQVNIVCPSEKQEEYIIYNVSKEEFESCRITSSEPRIIAKCGAGDRHTYFTITFRPFTPNPKAMEYHPGKDYYFITTSHPGDLYAREGGRCLTHNMKVIFKVADNSQRTTSTTSWPSPPSTRPAPSPEPATETKLDPNLYYSVMDRLPQNFDLDLVDDRRRIQNEVIKQEASRMASPSSSTRSCSTYLLTTVTAFILNIIIRIVGP